MNTIRSRTERGASAVEFALVIPFLCLILFGMVTTGFTYSDHLSVTNAVREGARLGAALPYDPATPSDWADSVQDRVYDVYFNDGGTLTKSDVCVKLVPKTGSAPASTGTNCGTEPAFDVSSMAAGSCVVKVWVRKSAKIELVIAPSLDFNIGAKSVSYYGRTVGVCTAQ